MTILYQTGQHPFRRGPDLERLALPPLSQTLPIAAALFLSAPAFMKSLLRLSIILLMAAVVIYRYFQPLVA
jgi:hypothetical protein